MEYSSTPRLFPARKRDSISLNEAIEFMSESGIEARGAVFTRREIVDFLLDLVGYTSDKPLYEARLLEPSFGEGDFLIPAIQRLIDSYCKQNVQSSSYIHLKDAIKAVELHKSSFENTKQTIFNLLQKEDFSIEQSVDLADSWLIRGDYLLETFDIPFDYVVGNPPYIRQEAIPDILLTEYKKHFRTIYDRADIYIPFIEKSLLHLTKGGALGFICSDRWMKNRYGGPLRKMISERFHLKIYVDMVNTSAFHTEVDAYPAITIITNEKASRTMICHKPEIDKNELKAVANALLSKQIPNTESSIKSITNVVSGSQPWLIESHENLSLIRRLEKLFPDLEKSGCKVGIGVATGMDEAFISPYDEMKVEADRKLPLIMTKDIQSGTVEWLGYGVINPFADNGSLVDLENYPKLKKYLEARKELILNRHIAKKSPSNWYRTIDRIYPELVKTPKLLIPDIKGKPHIVYESGQFYPHHNLYYILSYEWDLKALRALLLSGIAHMFISMYSTRMRGDYLRYQAQHLRRIRLPRWTDISFDIRSTLIAAAECNDSAQCDNLIFRLYGLSERERSIVRSYKSS